MSLHIYRKKEEVPEGIKIVDGNDAYFDMLSIIPNTKLSQFFLEEIDHATYYSELAFKSQNPKFGNLKKENLSTGTKTLLNILNHPNVCFNVVECGGNVKDLFPMITEGHILWENCVYAYDGDEKCDVVYKGKHYTDFYDFLQDVFDESKLSLEEEAKLDKLWIEHNM